MPAPSASRMAATESLSSWAPQANSQPAPPIAQAPKPIGVMDRSEFPSRFVFMVSPSLSRREVSSNGVAGRQRSFLPPERRGRAKPPPAPGMTARGPGERGLAASGRSGVLTAPRAGEVDRHGAGG